MNCYPPVPAASLLSNCCLGGIWEQVPQFSHKHNSVFAHLTSGSGQYDPDP